MKTRYRVYIDGVPLDTLDKNIYITDIEESSPDMATETAQIIGHGMRVVSQFTNSMDVTVYFMLRDYSTFKRQRSLDNIKQWARGNVLTASHRPGKRLRVVVKDYPNVSALRWTDTLAITFTATNPPYWEEEAPSIATIESNRASAEIEVPGTAEYTECDLKITAKGVVNGLKITTPLSVFQLHKLNMDAGDVLTIDHDDSNRIRMMVTSVDGETYSIYNRRTAESDDEIRVPCGAKSTITKMGNADYEIRARGRWI